MPGGFSSLPKVTAVKPWKAPPATVAAESVAFDEDGRRLLTEPIAAPAAARPVTVAPRGGFYQPPRPPSPAMRIPPGPPVKPSAPAAGSAYERTGDGAWRPRPLRAGEKVELDPDTIPY